MSKSERSIVAGVWGAANDWEDLTFTVSDGVIVDAVHGSTTWNRPESLYGDDDMLDPDGEWRDWIVLPFGSSDALTLDRMLNELRETVKATEFENGMIQWATAPILDSENPYDTLGWAVCLLMMPIPVD